MLYEILIPTQFSGMIASHTTMISTCGSIIEAVYREVHHTIMRIFICHDCPIGLCDGPSLLCNEVLIDEMLIVEVTLIYQPQVP